MFADLVTACRRSVVALDCDASGRIHRVSAAAGSGLRRQALLDVLLVDLLDPGAEARAARERALAAARRWEHLLVGEDGDALRIEEAPRFDDDGAPIGSTVVLTAAVDDLAGAPASLHALACDSAEVGLWAWDVAADRVVCSPGVFELFGVANGTTIDFGAVAQRIHPEDRVSWEAAVRRTAETGEPFDEELRIYRGAGGVRWVSTRGSGVRGRDDRIRLLVGTVADVTAARRARVGLEQTSAMLTRVERMAGMGSWEWNLVSGEVAWSEGIRRIFGLGDDSLDPDPAMLLPFVDPEDEPVLLAAVDRARREGMPYDLELRIVVPGGGRRLARVLGMAEQRDGRTVRLFGSLQDITGLRETELALRESEAMLARTERFAQIGSWDWDGATRTLHWSDQLYRLLGRDPAEGPLRIEDVPEAILSREDRRRWGEAFDAALRTGRPQELEVAIRRANGEGRSCIARIGVLRPRGRDGEQRVFGSFQDVTDRRRAAAALERSEARFRAFLEHFPGAAFIKDADSVHVYANRRTMEMTGCFDDALIGRTTTEVFPGETGAHLARTDARVLREGRSVSEEYLVRTGDGREFWTHDVKFPIPLPGDERPLLGGFALDVTARKTLEVERERLRLAIEQSSEMVLVTDAEECIQYANPALLAGAGYTAEELVGRSVDVLRSADPAAWGEVQALLRAGQSWSGRMRDRRRDGSHFTCEGTISPVFDEDGTIVAHVTVKRDITRELALTEQIHHAQKLDSIGRLAGGIAHDFNNMLHAILGNVEMALVDFGPEGELRELLEEIRSAASRSATLAGQMLAFAREQVVRPRLLDLNETVRPTLRMLERALGERIRTVWTGGTGLWRVRMDPSQVDQVLTNLCVNARDAIPGTGTLEISTENVRLDERAAEASGHAPGDYVRLRVRDDGVGMAPEVIEHVFEPFFTTKDVGQGTGLGLATVYGIVSQNQGFLTVDSAPGRGTVFDVHLPRHHGEVGEAPAEARVFQNQLLPVSAQTVLLVEDERLVLDLCRRLLTRLGYEVLAAANPAEALTMVEAHEGALELLVTDVVMPGSNGRELADRLRERFPELRVLFMSGFAADVIAEQGVLPADTHFIGKPFTAGELASKVAEILTLGR